MMNKHLGEIIAAINDERRQLDESVSGLSQSQFDFGAGEEAWSIGEILDHLDLSERGIVKLIKLSVLKSAKSDVSPRDEATGENEWLTSLDRFQIETVTRKLKAIEQIMPRAGLARDDVLDSLRRSRAELTNELEAAAHLDFTQINFPHPFLGEFNLYQWARFIGKHELRHLNQIEAVKRDANFPANESARFLSEPPAVAGG